MNWFLVNALGAIPALVSLTVFIIVTRKTAHSIRVANTLARRLNKARANIDDSVVSLRKEHLAFRSEAKKLDAKIYESARARAEIDRTVAHMIRLRNHLQQELIRTKAISKPAMQKAGGVAAHGAEGGALEQRQNLPVFVRRRVADSPATNHYSERK